MLRAPVRTATTGETPHRFGLSPALVGVISFILLIAFLSSLRSLRLVYGGAEAVTHSYAVKGALERLLTTAVDAETGERGFIITGQEEYLAPYERARLRMATVVDEVRTLTADNPEQQEDVQRLISGTAMRLSELAEGIRQRRDAGLAAAQTIVRTNVGKHTMDEMRVVVARMEAREDALLKTRTLQAATRYRAGTVTALLTTAVALLALGGLFVATGRVGAARRRATQLAERLKVTFRSIGDAVIVTDERGRVTELNPIAETLTGWRHADAAGRDAEEVLTLLHVETRRPAENPIGRVLRDGITVGLANHTVLIAKDGRETPVDDSAAPIKTADGQVTGVVMVFRDVTERHRAERERAALTEAERVARMQAESASRTKDEFLAMLGHELRNPLSPIVTALQLMKLRGDSTSERERIIIERQVTHLVRLVEDLLDVSRVTQGKVVLKAEIVDMAEMLARAIETCSPLFEQKAHTLSIDVPPGLHVLGDATRLGQVISNLLTNAAKYTPRHGAITIQAGREADTIVLRVRDTGIGIAPNVLPLIFDLFVQEAQAIDRAEGGLGLGLTIARSLVERHHGTIEAHSEGQGRGSEFVVRLPAAAVPIAPTDSATLAQDQPRATTNRARRILIVDDNVDAAELLAIALRGSNHHAHVAHDAPSALEAVEEFAPDVAILDIGLPVMDGYELAVRLRRIPGLERLQLIALTGYGQDADRIRSRMAGFDHFLVKPVDLDDMTSLVDAHPAPSPDDVPET